MPQILTIKPNPKAMPLTLKHNPETFGSLALSLSLTTANKVKITCILRDLRRWWGSGGGSGDRYSRRHG